MLWVKQQLTMVVGVIIFIPRLAPSLAQGGWLMGQKNI
jgi:hypothetical protein